MFWIEFPPGWYTPVITAMMFVLGLSQLLEGKRVLQKAKVEKDGG